MGRKTISNFCAIPAAIFLVVIGLLHSFFSVSGGRRMMERRGPHGATWRRLHRQLRCFQGLALSLLGLLVFLVLPGLRAGSHARPRAWPSQLEPSWVSRAPPASCGCRRSHRS